jgi:hypothetical protein
MKSTERRAKRAELLILDVRHSVPLSDPFAVHAEQPRSRAVLSCPLWRTGLAKPLNTTLLNDLVTLGYVFPEQELRQRRKASDDRSRQRRRGAAQALFQGRRIARPPARSPGTPTAQVPGTVLLMRVRRASETARRTQIQLPIRVVDTNFFHGLNSIVSAHDGRTHPLVRAAARGSLNTIKTEIPEIEPMADPVLRLERTPTAIIYQAFDAASVLGTPIRQALLHGFAMNPPATAKTVADQSKATWWRFI